MRAFDDLTGRVFGRLTVLNRAPNRGIATMWYCKCSCGNDVIKAYSASDLKNGKTQSCGCLRKELISSRCRIDLKGRIFGRLTAVECVGTDNFNNAMWKCVCSCDNHTEVITSATHLLSGHTQSCGCYARDRNSETHIKYSNPLDRHLAVKLLGSMKDRCYNPNCRDYGKWGGRGITICDEWLNNPQAFADWAKANGYQEGLSIERIDNNGPYCKENCRFIPIGEQSLNRRNVRLITYNGDTKSVTAWARIIHVTPIKLYPLTDDQVLEKIQKYFSK